MLDGRRMNFERWLTSDWVKLDEPYKFTHNERFRDWFAWVCRHCGIVRLETDEAPTRWFCDVCRLKNRLSTGPLKFPE